MFRNRVGPDAGTPRYDSVRLSTPQCERVRAGTSQYNFPDKSVGRASACRIQFGRKPGLGSVFGSLEDAHRFARKGEAAPLDRSRFELPDLMEYHSEEQV